MKFSQFGQIRSLEAVVSFKLLKVIKFELRCCQETRSCGRPANVPVSFLSQAESRGVWPQTDNIWSNGCWRPLDTFTRFYDDRSFKAWNGHQTDDPKDKFPLAEKGLRAIGCQVQLRDLRRTSRWHHNYQAMFKSSAVKAGKLASSWEFNWEIGYAFRLCGLCDLHMLRLLWRCQETPHGSRNVWFGHSNSEVGESKDFNTYLVNHKTRHQTDETETICETCRFPVLPPN